MRVLLVFSSLLCLASSSDLTKMLGQFSPQYVEGTHKLKPMQCWGSTGLCWCAYDASIKPFPLSLKDEINIKCPKNERKTATLKKFVKYVEKRKLKRKKKNKETIIAKVWGKIQNGVVKAVDWFTGFKTMFKK